MFLLFPIFVCALLRGSPWVFVKGKQKVNRLFLVLETKQLFSAGQLRILLGNSGWECPGDAC